MTLIGRVLAVIALVLAIATGPTQAQPETLRIGISQYPSTLNPLIDPMLAKSYVLGFARRAMMAYGPDWTLQCHLCTEVPTMENGLAEIEPLENGDEGMAVRVAIKEEARWGDGTPVTIDDLILTWQVGKHPEAGVSNFDAFQQILEIEKLGAKTAVIHSDRVDYKYNDLSGLDLLPAHLEREVFEADPRQYKNRTTFDADPTNPGLYNGPYRIAEVVSGSHVVLEANPEWWGKPPRIARIIVRAIENTAALEANLLSGEIDMIAGELGLNIDQALAFEERHGEDFKILFKPGLIYEHIDMNLDNPILADIRVRKALILGANRRAISEQLFQGRQPVAHSSVSPLDWVHEEDVPKYAYDPEAAAALLDAAGWTEMRQGFRHDAEGKRLRLQFMTTAGDRTRELVQQVLQQGWRELGIDAVIDNEPPRVYFGQTLTQRRYTGLALYAWISAPESLPRTTLQSDQIPTEENNWAGQNYTGYQSEAMDRLIDAIEVELDRTERKALWADLQRLYAKDLPVLPLYWRANTFVLPRALQGIEPTGHLAPTSLWAEHWHWAN